MAMTKRERAAFEATLREARILGALRWTEPVPPDVPVPTYAQGIVKGWSFNALTERVQMSCSSVSGHTQGDHAWSELLRHMSSQRGIPQYSTKALALKALRYAMAHRSACMLARIDELIAAEAERAFMSNQPESQP
jgi:hypothetical protein